MTMPVRTQSTPLDAAMLVHLFAALELRQQQAPTPERAEALERLRPLRNRAAHGMPIRAEDVATAAELGTYLEQLEGTSLGGSFARAVRAHTPAADLADVLDRSERKIGKRDTRQDTPQHQGPGSAPLTATERVRTDLIGTTRPVDMTSANARNNATTRTPPTRRRVRRKISEVSSTLCCAAYPNTSGRSSFSESWSVSAPRRPPKP